MSDKHPWIPLPNGRAGDDRKDASAKPPRSQRRQPAPPRENALHGPGRAVPEAHERPLSEQPPGGRDPSLPCSQAPGGSIPKATVTVGGTRGSAPSRQRGRARLTRRSLPSGGRHHVESWWILDLSFSRPPGRPTSRRGLLWGWRSGGVHPCPRCAHPTCSRGPHSTCPLAGGGAPGSQGTPTRRPGAAGLQAACTPQARAAPRPASARLSRGLRAGGPGVWQRRGQAPTCASRNSGGQFGHKEQGVGAAAPLVRRQAQPRPRCRRTHSLGTFQKPGEAGRVGSRPSLPRSWPRGRLP